MEIREIYKRNIAEVSEVYNTNGCPLNSYEKASEISWILDDYPLALVLVVDNVFVGWIQTIFSNEQGGVICNLSSWYVHEGFRHYSLNLMLYIRSKFKTIPVTVFTPSGKAARIYDALKTRKLDSSRWSYVPREKNIFAEIFEYKFFSDISTDLQKIIIDNTTKEVVFFVIRTNDGLCVFSLRERERNGESVLDLLSLHGDVDLFFDGFKFNNYAKSKSKVLIDDRFVPKRIKKYLVDHNYLSECRLQNPRYVIDSSDDLGDFNFLYSEVVINNSSLL